MSPVTRTRRDGSVRPARYHSVQPGIVAWLTLVWLILWQDFSLFGVLTGVLVGIGICLVFPLPPLRMHLRIRPVALAWLVLKFHVDVVMASIEVVGVTLRPRRDLHNAVIAVPLRTPSDFVLTVVGEMVSLVPGSLVVEAQRSTHTLYLHVLDMPDKDAVEHFRQRVYEQEQRVVRAFGAYVDHLDLPPDLAREDALEAAIRRDRKDEQ